MVHPQLAFTAARVGSPSTASTGVKIKTRYKILETKNDRQREREENHLDDKARVPWAVEDLSLYRPVARF